MSGGPVGRFEDAFASWVGAERGCAVWKGRVAMYAILQALGVGEGDEVILPGYTCVMDVNPIMYLGAIPRYADIDPTTYNAQPDLVEKLITPRTKVLVAQHTYGIPCDMEAYCDIADRHGLALIEDCCLALGSTFNGQKCGTFGQAAYWSFQWNKPFTTGLGGMATANDADLGERITALCHSEGQSPSHKAAGMLALQRLVYQASIYPRTTALATQTFRWLTRLGLVVGSSATCEFNPAMPEGFFTTMSESQAVTGLRQLSRVEENLAHRRRLGCLYQQQLRQAGFDVPTLDKRYDPAWVRYPVRVADKERAVTEAPKHFIELGTWFECPLHPAETPMEAYGYTTGLCPEAERASRDVVNLPTHPRANTTTVRRGVEFVRRIGPAGRSA